MRIHLAITFVLTTMVAACTTKGDIPPGTHIPQSGVLKIHPGLLGQPVPAELQADTTAAPSAETILIDPQIKMDPVGLRTQRSVYFDLNSATIKAEYEPALHAHARYLADHPEARLRIEGNADERGSTEHNHRLGQQRANNVRSTLLANGATEKQISIKSLGASHPKLKGHDETSWAENRRSDVVYEQEN